MIVLTGGQTGSHGAFSVLPFRVGGASPPEGTRTMKSSFECNVTVTFKVSAASCLWALAAIIAALR